MDLVKQFGADALERLNNSEQAVKDVGERKNYVRFQGKGKIYDTPWTYGPKDDMRDIPGDSVFMVKTHTMQHGYSGFEDMTGTPPSSVMSSWLDAFPDMPAQEWMQQVTYKFNAVCVHSSDKSLVGKTFVFEERRAFKEGFRELENACRARLRDGLTRQDQDILARMYPLIAISWQEGIKGKYGTSNKAYIKFQFDDERTWVGPDTSSAPQDEEPGLITEAFEEPVLRRASN